MPGSQIYEDYLGQGRIFTELSWDHYGGESVIFKHPTMDPEEMFELNAHVFRKGYSTGRILVRALHTMKNRFSLGVGLNSFFTQIGLRKGFRERYKRSPRKSES